MRKLIIASCILLSLSACGKAPQDKFIGNWNYEGAGRLMTVPLKCIIDLTIEKNNGEYILTSLNLRLTPSVFGLSGGEFFHNAPLKVKDETNMVTPELGSSKSPIVITYLKNSNQLSLNPNPCSGITSDGVLSKKN